MLTKILHLCNENHWYLIAGAVCIIFGVIMYGCESQCKSLLDGSKEVNRLELEAEIEYLAKIADSRVQNLNKQDEIFESLSNALVLIGEGGSVNTTGVVNLAATIFAVSFGLDRNRKYKNANKNPNTV